MCVSGGRGEGRERETGVEWGVGRKDVRVGVRHVFFVLRLCPCGYRSMWWEGTPHLALGVDDGVHLLHDVQVDLVLRVAHARLAPGHAVPDHEVLLWWGGGLDHEVFVVVVGRGLMLSSTMIMRRFCCGGEGGRQTQTETRLRGASIPSSVPNHQREEGGRFLPNRTWRWSRRAAPPTRPPPSPWPPPSAGT